MVFAIIIGISSCSKKEETKPEPEQKVHYKNDVYNIMYNNCVTCHSGNGASANLDLSNYANVKSATETGTLISRMNDENNPMPPTGLLPNSKTQMIKDWKDQGYLE